MPEQERDICGAEQDMLILSMDGPRLQVSVVCQMEPGHYDPETSPHGYSHVWVNIEDEPDHE